MKLLVEILGVDQAHVELDDLQDSLAKDQELSPVTVRPTLAPRIDGALSGVAKDLVLVFGGVGAALVQALTAWLAGRDRTMRMRVSRGSQSVDFEVRQARDHREAVEVSRQLLALLAEDTEQPSGEDEQAVAGDEE